MKQRKTELQEIENGALKFKILNAEELKQLKGGTAGGEEDDGAVDRLIVID